MQYANLETLTAQMGGMEPVVKQIVGKFVETTPPVLASMQEFLAAGDHESLGKAAHKLKSTCAHMGIAAALPHLLRLERIWKENSGHDQAPAALSDLLQAMAPALAELGAYAAA